MNRDERYLQISMDVLSRVGEGVSAGWEYASRKHGVTQARIRQAFWKCLARHKDRVIDALEKERQPVGEREPTYSELVECLGSIEDADDMERLGVDGQYRAAAEHARTLLSRLRRSQFPSLMQKRR